MSASLGILLTLLGLAALIGCFFGGFKIATKLTREIWAQVLLTFVFGGIFCVALIAAAVAGCIAIAGSPTYR